MLDTNACIALIKSRPEAMRIRFSGLSMDEVGISSIVAAELWYGVALSQKKRQNEAALRDFLDYVAATRTNPNLSIYTFIDRPL